MRGWAFSCLYTPRYIPWRSLSDGRGNTCRRGTLTSPGAAHHFPAPRLPGASWLGLCVSDLATAGGRARCKAGALWQGHSTSASSNGSSQRWTRFSGTWRAVLQSSTTLGHESRRCPHTLAFPADVVLGSRDVLCGADDEWHALVQLGRLQPQDVFGAGAGTAPSLLGHEG